MQGYFTPKGLALSAKLLIGDTLAISRVVAGSGQTQTMASALSSPCQTLAVNSPTRSGNTATIPATLAAASASGSYTLTELGVYANDPDEGEILYKVYKLSRPVDITAGSSMVLRFYLEETVSQGLDIAVTCSPAGLVTEANLTPVKEKLFATITNSRNVSLEAFQLQAFLNSLPRLLTENITITVSGTTDDYIIIKSFYGSGCISIKAADSGCTIRRQLQVDDCSLDVWLEGLSFDGTASLDRMAMLLVWYSASVHITDCLFQGNGDGTGVGIVCTHAVRFLQCAFKNFECALKCFDCSTASLYACTDVSGNNYGFQSSFGSVVGLSGGTPELLGGTMNYKSGGIIVKSDGTLL